MTNKMIAILTLVIMWLLVGILTIITSDNGTVGLVSYICVWICNILNLIILSAEVEN